MARGTAGSATTALVGKATAQRAIITQKKSWAAERPGATASGETGRERVTAGGASVTNLVSWAAAAKPETALVRATASAVAAVAGITASPPAAAARATVSADTTRFASTGTVRNAVAILTVLACGTAGGASDCAVAVAAAISITADRRGVHIATLPAQSPAVGSITGTLTCGWCIRTKDSVAPFGAVAIALLPAGPVAIRRAPMMPTEGGAYTADT